MNTNVYAIFKQQIKCKEFSHGFQPFLMKRSSKEKTENAFLFLRDMSRITGKAENCSIKEGTDDYGCEFYELQIGENVTRVTYVTTCDHELWRDYTATDRYEQAVTNMLYAEAIASEQQ